MSLIKGFISYAWESDGNKDWVRKLGTDLQSNGIELALDQWDTHPGMELAQWMETSIRNASHVFLICSPVFADKANARTGGVGYEQSIITEEMFHAVSQEGKFVPLLRSGDAAISLPSYLKSRIYIDFRNDRDYQGALESLLRHVYGARKHMRPPLGNTPSFVNSPTKDANLSRTIDPQIFMLLKDFAYSPDGLNMSAKEAGAWAMSEWAKFDLDSAGRHVSKFKALRRFAYDPDGLNLSASDAKNWALSHLDTFVRVDFAAFTDRYSELRQFAYSPSGLDKSSSEATSWALEQVKREFQIEL